MYKVGQTLGYVVHCSDEQEKLIRLTITDVIFSQFDEAEVDKYLVDFRDNETERQVDSLLWHPHIYPTWQEFVNAASYEVTENIHEITESVQEEMMVSTPVGELVIGRLMDPDYPGVYIDLHDQHGEVINLVVAEHHLEKGLRTLIWSDVNYEDYTHAISINAKEKGNLFHKAS